MERLVLKERILTLFFPNRCLWCGEVTRPGEPVCPRCEPVFPKEALHSILVTQGIEKRLVFCAAPFSLHSNFKRALYEFKFQKNRDCLFRLAVLMARAAESFPALADGIAFVPMTKEQQRRRKQNHSQVLAQAVAKQMKVPLLACLTKVRETETQHSLSREERLKNVDKAYSATAEAAGKNIIVVDDVLTTGATAKDCARALYEAGAKRVCVLCAALSEKEFSAE